MSDIELRIRELEATNLIKVIHYACESWFIVKDRPVTISCITIIDFRTHEEICFSLTDASEDPEEKLLERYYLYLRQSPDARYVHWNMNTSDFGFEAINNRYRYLYESEPPYSVPQEMRYDLDDLLQYRYEQNYIEHPKLYEMAALNGYQKRYMLTGKEEAERFAKKEYGDIKRSVIEKAHLIAFLTKRFLDGTIETKNSGPRAIFAGGKIDAVQIVLELAKKFKSVSRQLKHRHDNRPTIEIEDEYDAQDLFYALLRVFFDDVRDEEWTPNYAGGNKRMDFLLPAHSIAIELKHSRPSMKTKDLGEQLVIDIENYKRHGSVRLLVCIVFDDDGYIVNPRGIETDLSGIRESVMVNTCIID